ncbi:MAG: tRNA-(ms[2]io[6]A)-hydroxylase [Flavobacteriales bacterium]
MLGLKLPTDPRWVNIVEKNIEEILVDHAYCEQKAASNAISMIVQYPQYPDLVEAMVAISQEEMEHFGMVHDKLQERGLKLGFERKDPYVNDLAEYLKKTRIQSSRKGYFVNQMLFAAMIEARSCERFKILSEEINDEDLRDFYAMTPMDYFWTRTKVSIESHCESLGERLRKPCRTRTRSEYAFCLEFSPNVPGVPGVDRPLSAGFPTDSPRSGHAKRKQGRDISRFASGYGASIP